MTKEEAIEIIEFKLGRGKEAERAGLRNKGVSSWIGKVPEEREALEMAISALKGGWIPITEGMELPEHDVICCDNEGNIALGYLYFDEEENQIACDRDPYVMFGIVAYMELPEPYKAESEEV